MQEPFLTFSFPLQLNVRPNTNLLRPESSADFMAGDMRVNEHPFLTSLHTGEICPQEDACEIPVPK